MGTQAEPRVRVEVDLLGQREVPEQAYYGVHTLRAIENFRISHTTINDVPQMIRGMVMVKKASALAKLCVPALGEPGGQSRARHHPVRCR